MTNWLVLQTDFGSADGAVSSMYGVGYMVDPGLSIHDLTHEIPPYDIWAAGYRLYQAITYWPKGTVFVSVVDPGVGGHRRSVACLTKTGHYVITPDNGTLTFISHYIGIKEVREIDETVSRLRHSDQSHTFHGRDIYVYNGAKLASRKITFQTLGTSFPEQSLETLPMKLAHKANEEIIGTIDILDSRFGSLWTNIPHSFINDLNIHYQDLLSVRIYYQGKNIFASNIPFVRSFAEVKKGEPLVYINSLLNVAVAINQDSFAEVNQIRTGNDWTIRLK